MVKLELKYNDDFVPGLDDPSAQSTKMRTDKPSSMKQSIKDTAGLGTALWLIGYLASLVLFFTPYAGVMGWILLAVLTPVTILIALWWFRKRERLPLQYYAGVGVAWVLIAIVLDYLFIVLLFHASYYGIDVWAYYAVTFLIPVGAGLYLNRSRNDFVENAGITGRRFRQ